MRLIAFLVRSYPRSVALALIASLLCGATNTYILFMINAALREGAFARRGLVWTVVALSLLMAVSRFGTEVLLTHIAQGALFDLRMSISRQILGTPLRRLEEYGAARLLAILSDDLIVISAAPAVLSLLCVNLAIVAGGVVYLGMLSLKTLGAVLGVVAVGVIAYQLLAAKAIRYFRAAREDADRLFNHFRALTSGAKELKLHRRRREVFITKVLYSTAASLRRHHFFGTTIYSAASNLGQTLIYVVIALVVFVLPTLYRIDAPVLSGFTLMLLFIMSPLQVILNSMPTVARANVALNKVESFGLSLAAHGEEVRPAATPKPDPPFECLELASVTHAYKREGEKDNFTLGPIDVTISAGEMIFLVGGNGSGKTTLAKLIAGLYVPTTGEIRLNGAIVTEENREFHREQFSVIFSDFYLFESLLGLERPRLDETVRDYLSKLQLTNKVRIESGALSTVELSQGQRKRLALLAAYLEDRPFYIFDEWAADQDPFFKEVFYHRLLPELKANGKTAVVITHDDRYYHVADRIIRLENGQTCDGYSDAFAGTGASPHG